MRSGDARRDQLIAIRRPQIEMRLAVRANEPAIDVVADRGRPRGTRRRATRPLRSRPGPTLGPIAAIRSPGSVPNSRCMRVDRAGATRAQVPRQPGVNRRRRAAYRIDQENRHAVGDHHGQHQARLVRHDRVAVGPFVGWRLRAVSPSLQHPHDVAVDLLHAHHAIGRRPDRRERRRPASASRRNSSCLDVNKCCAAAASRAQRKAGAPSLAGSNEMRDPACGSVIARPADRRQPAVVDRAAPRPRTIGVFPAIRAGIALDHPSVGQRHETTTRLKTSTGLETNHGGQDHAERQGYARAESSRTPKCISPMASWRG